jgi:5-amino-6-(D-ribitylamino)uracil---L-tyrosine 4-hydroxyphenyl transferase
MYAEKQAAISDDIIERACQGKRSKEDALILLEGSPFELFELADTLRAQIPG